MATSFPFNGQIVKIPGVYSNIKSGIKNPSVSASFGSVLIIDTGSGAGYGGGAGIDGELTSGKDSFYEFDNIQDFQDFAKGGLWWLLASPLFRPAGLNANGVSKITYVKAATTTAASIPFTFAGAGAISVKVTDEGLIGNGVLVGSNLTKGFAAKIVKGTIDTTKFTLNFYRGTYKGLDQNGLPYDGINEANSIPSLLAKSIEVNTISELVAWMAIDFNFSKHFKLDSTATILGDDAIITADQVTYANYNLASNGTESYVATTLLDSVLEAATDADISFILSDNYGPDAQSNINFKILTHIKETSKFKPELYIGGGNDINTYASQSIATSVFFNDDSVSVVHGAIKKNSQLGVRIYNSIYQTAAVLGREAGIEPQVPITFKNIDVDGEVHVLNDREVVRSLDAGVIVVRLDNGSFDIIKGINSLQMNNFLINDNGTTSSKQIKRISRQLNKELIINAKQQLLKQPNGVNRNTLSEDDVRSFLVAFLKLKKATQTSDNLIIDFSDITVSRVGDAYNVTYRFTPNSEISLIFFNGLIINV